MKKPLFTPINWYHVLGYIGGLILGAGTAYFEDWSWWSCVAASSLGYFATKWLASLIANDC